MICRRHQFCNGLLQEIFAVCTIGCGNQQASVLQIRQLLPLVICRGNTDRWQAHAKPLPYRSTTRTHCQIGLRHQAGNVMGLNMTSEIVFNTELLNVFFVRMLLTNHDIHRGSDIQVNQYLQCDACQIVSIHSAKEHQDVADLTCASL